MTQGLIFTWEGVVAMSTVLAGAVALTGYYFRIMVKSAISDAMQSVLETADNRYVGQQVCEERHGGCRREVEGRIDRLEKPKR